MESRVNSENAELIGRPIIEGIIEAHSNSDYDKLIELVRGMKGKLAKEEFDEAASSVKTLGRVLSIGGFKSEVHNNLNSQKSHVFSH